MNLSQASKKEVGERGERAAERYLVGLGMTMIGRNIARKTGEIDLMMKKGDTLHFVEVKALLCERFPRNGATDCFDPSANLHEAKIRRVARTAEWIVAERDWEGEWQVDGVLVWLRHDGESEVTYLPQIV